jgi:hypothetical protein
MMISTMTIALLIGAAVIAAAVGFLLANRLRSTAILRKWAAEHRLRIVQVKRCFTCGPFPWFASSKTIVFTVSVTDDSGRIRNGWVRCGSRYGGVLFCDDADVIWKEEDEPNHRSQATV